jgi:photosystem II stability/assembly factor-like uncharacterized protein
LGLTVAAVPSGVNAYKRWRDATRRASIKDFLQSKGPGLLWKMTPEAQARLEQDEASGPYEESWDDAFARKMAERSARGGTPPAVTEQWAQVARAEARKWNHLMPRNVAQPGDRDAELPAAFAGVSWVNLGPTDARFQFNAVQYNQVDSGRTTGIAVHPENPDIAYTSTSGGGIWKTFDFSAADPRWYPVSENIPNLAIGALAMDPKQPDTLYAGLGDVFDVPGGQIIKTTDGGATWSAPVALKGSYTFPLGNMPVSATAIRSIVVDPSNTNIVLVGTNMGLFRSTDAGKSFALVDLPNAVEARAEAIWSIVHTGEVGGVSRWAITGVYASFQGGEPPEPAFGDEDNPGDIWLSTDAGATWSSNMVAGKLPPAPAGRIDLAGGTPKQGATTVLYAQVAAAHGRAGAGLWRSLDSGQNWADVTGTLANPSEEHCLTQDIASQQAYYNQAVVVDPANDAHVLLGGMLCGMRTINGTAASPTWELISHWLPELGGATPDGTLPYVHADWHLARVVRTANGYMAIAGTDGGLFVSRNVFASGPVNDTTVTWAFPNRGIVSHLFYSVASGDVTTGNAFVAYGGLQDNGTRFRDSKERPTTFNQVSGGDGLGATVAQVPGNTVYWGSVQGRPLFCDPDHRDCNAGGNWWTETPAQLTGGLLCPEDGMPFQIRFATIRDATATTGPAVLTISYNGVYRYKGDPNDSFITGSKWELLGDPSKTDGTGACVAQPNYQQDVVAAATLPGVYGVATGYGRFRVSTNCFLSTPAAQCTWSTSKLMGVDLNKNGTIDENEALPYASSMDFPPGPTGLPAGQVFVGASSSATAWDFVLPVSDALGRLFLTRDGGQTWQSLKGNGTGFDLPNVPINVVRYDPGDATNNTIYVGTNLGIYRTRDGGATWQRFGHGMPIVRVMDLFVSQSGSLLRAATYGRGLWEMNLAQGAERGVSGNGDFDRNLALDYLDVMATSVRLGTTPATTQAPYYHWNQDMAGAVNAIDESDLASLVSKYGGRP